MSLSSRCRRAYKQRMLSTRMKILRALTMPRVDPNFFVQSPHASPSGRNNEFTIDKASLNEFAAELMKLKGKGKLWHQLPFLCFGNYIRNTIGFRNHSCELRPMCYLPPDIIHLSGVVTA